MKILKNIKNMLSPSAKAEQRVLESWREEYIQQLESLENAGKNESFNLKWQNYKDYRPEEAWQKFEEKMKATRGSEKTARSARIYYLAGAAAILVVFGIWWLSRVSNSNELPWKFQAGNSAKELTLEDNSLVVLDSFSDLE